MGKSVTLFLYNWRTEMNKTMTFQVNSNINVSDDYANPAGHSMQGRYTSNSAHKRKINAYINFEVEIPVGKHYADDDYAQLEADVQNVIKVATDNSRLMLEAIRPVDSKITNYRYSTEPSENPDAGFISYPDGERDQPF
jgi:hypothetical protein